MDTMHNKRTGDFGEKLAKEYLGKQGYSILDCNWRFHHLEVDIIASKDRILHFIEVKTRTSTKFGPPEASVSRDKMLFLKNAAMAYQAAHPEWKYIQFDVLAINLSYGKSPVFFFNRDVYF